MVGLRDRPAADVYGCQTARAVSKCYPGCERSTIISAIIPGPAAPDKYDAKQRLQNWRPGIKVSPVAAAMGWEASHASIVSRILQPR